MKKLTTNNVTPIILVLFSLLSVGNFSAQTEDNNSTLLFSKDNFRRHLNFLGSDIFEGRAPGKLGGNLSAKYLALEYDKLKLKPMGDNNSYYQQIPFHSSKPELKSQLKIFYDSEEIEFKLKEDFVFSQSVESVYIPTSTPLVFVGYGIVAPEYDYNDYQNVDVEGKIVVFLEGEPKSMDSTYFAGSNPTIYSTEISKQRIALSRGARGTILIPNTAEYPDEHWKNIVNAYSFENLSLAYSASSSFDIIMNPLVADILFMANKYSLKDVYNLKDSYKMESFPLNVKLSFTGTFTQEDFLSPNLIGMIEGNDPDLKDSYIIISAHYDHLGIGPAVKGDSIYNGVFDNAMGVSALLEIARVLKNFSKPKRSIIFLLLTGEEAGLLGSEYYTQNPVVPLYKTIADINIDGLAAFDNFKSIVTIGSEFSTLKDYSEQIANKFNLKITQIPSYFESYNAFNKSDQYSFAKAGIPSLLIMDGNDYFNLSRDEGLNLLKNYSENIYHSPFDDLNQKINYEACIQHMNLLYSLIMELANEDKEPEWFNGVVFKNARLNSRAQKR